MLTFRLQTWNDVKDGRDTIDLATVFTGTVEQCKQYATDSGYSWVRDRRQLFGGYYAHKQTGDCLIPDVALQSNG